MGRPGTQITPAESGLALTEFPNSKEDGALLSWIQEFAPFGVITLNGLLQVQTWNHWMEIHSGWRLEEVVGKGLFSLFPELPERKLAPHFERALAGESFVLSTGLHHYLLPLPSPFRELGRVQMLQTARIAPLFSNEKICGVVIVLEDVTQRESQAEALRRQHRRDEILSWALVHLLKPGEPHKTVRQLFFKIAEYLEFDTFCLYLRDMNQGTLRLYASGGIPTQSQKDFEECPFLGLMPPAPTGVSVLDSIQRRSQPELAVLKQAGISAAIVVPLLAENRSFGLLCFATTSREAVSSEEADLLTTVGQYLATALDRENTSRELHQAKEQLSDYAQHLEEKVQERTLRLEETISELETFSYTVAHDLKAPIRGMTAYCGILLEDFGPQLTPAANNIVQKLARTTRRMETLAQDLLAFSKVSRQEVRLSRVELEPMIEDLIAVRAASVAEAITIQKPLPPILAQPELLEKVLSNLIDNAIKFVRPQTAPRITISCEPVEGSSPNTRAGALLFNSPRAVPSPTGGPAAKSPRKYIRIWVVDEGIGIPPEIFHKIFGIFERGVTAEHYEGTGIGLAIVARATQRMGGTCGVESAPGKGSRFWIELPAA